MGRSRIEDKTYTEPHSIVEVASNTLSGYPHLVSITAVHNEKEKSIELIYTFSDFKGALKNISTKIPEDKKTLSSIASVAPAASIYEQEVSELFGVTFDGNPFAGKRVLLPDCFPNDVHPLLKDVKQEDLEKVVTGCMLGEPQIYVTGSSRYSAESVILLPFGPYHPALKEPERFILVLEGETIVDVIPKIGHVHRGIEKIAEGRTFLQDLFLVERICGICSFIHSWTFTLAVEELLNVKPSKKAEYLRTMVAELERIHSHVLWIGLLGYWTGFESMFMWIWRLREKIMSLLDLLTGNRVHKSFIAFGGVRKDVADEKLNTVAKTIAEFEKDYKKLIDEIMSYEPLVERIKGIGMYNAEHAIRLGAVGPMIRAAGAPYDIRKVEPYGAYDEIDFNVVTGKGGDVFNVTMVRIKEVLESINIIRQCIEKMPRNENPVPKILVSGVVKEGEAVARTEAPRGELFYYVKAANSRNPHRVKIRTPTLANILLAADMLKGYTLSDVPVIITSIDPCFSCMDRVLVVDKNHNSAFFVDFNKLRKENRVAG